MLINETEQSQKYEPFRNLHSYFYKFYNIFYRRYPLHILPVYRFRLLRKGADCFRYNNCSNTASSQKLDSIIVPACAAILSPCPQIFTGSDRIAFRSKKTDANKRGTDKANAEARRSGESVMPIFKLKPYETQLFGYKVDPKYRRFRFTVESDEKVTVYLVDRDEAMKFKSGQSFHSHLKSKELHYHEDEVKLPYGGDWYLVIHNPSSQIAAISYEVY